MLLIAEIGLTVWACIKLGQAKKGWGLGLLPIAGVIVGAIIMTLLGATASTIVIVDILAVGALIWIIASTKVSKNTPPPLPPTQ